MREACSQGVGEAYQPLIDTEIVPTAVVCALHARGLAGARDGAGGNGLTIIQGRLARDAQRVPMARHGARFAWHKGEAIAPFDVFGALRGWGWLIGVFVDVARGTGGVQGASRCFPTGIEVLGVRLRGCREGDRCRGRCGGEERELRCLVMRSARQFLVGLI